MNLQQALKEYEAHRKLLKRPLTPYGLGLVEKRLAKIYPDDEERQIHSINQSIERGWQGVFPIQEDTETGEFA